jgi:hypothetical protein
VTGFEVGRFHTLWQADAPTHVPAPNDGLLRSPYSFLLTVN